MEIQVPKVSIVILPFDNVKFFERAANSILENTYYPDFELIIAHNPCENEEINAAIRSVFNQLPKTHAHVSYTRNETNLMHARGSMEGVRVASNDTKYVVLCNDDIFIPGNQLNWLQTMVDFMEAIDHSATVTPCLLYPNETIYWMGKQDPNQPMHDYLHAQRNDPRLPKQPFTTCYNNMAVCMTRKYLLDEIPLGQSCSHYGSDSEYANRIKDKYPDMEHFVLPQIKLYHWNIYNMRENHGDEETAG